MALTSYGLPLPFGQTLRPAESTVIPYHYTAGPDNFTLTWNTGGYLQINSIKNTDKELKEKGTIVNSELFAFVNMNNLTSNITLTNVIDGTSIIQNSEINSYAYITGKINLNGIAYGTDNFNAVTSTILRYWMWKIKKHFNVSLLNTVNVSTMSYSSLLSILQTTYNSYLTLSSSYLKFDISSYANLICCCYASLPTILAYYNENGKFPTTLNIDVKLKQIDSVFYSYYKNTPELTSSVNLMVNVIYNILCNLNNTDSFINNLISINTNAEVLMGSNYDFVEFNDYLCGKIGASLSLSYLLSCIENIGSTSSSSGLLMIFALPQKYLYV